MRSRYKTKFPVARIKKIMRLDEEVGKVAQVTPVLISKALECFLQALLDSAQEEARRLESKKVTRLHLKHVIEQEDQFDFLRDFVSDIVDPTAK